MDNHAESVPEAKKVKVIGWTGTFIASGHIEVITKGVKVRLINVRFEKPLPSGRFARFRIDERDLEYLD